MQSPGYDCKKCIVKLFLLLKVLESLLKISSNGSQVKLLQCEQNMVFFYLMTHLGVQPTKI